MTALRILHVDDEPDIRELVALSLGLDPELSVRSCASGEDAITAAAEWSPDVILCDVMMPVMDGPATLARLRQCPQTAYTPVVFMTARAQKRELDHFKALGVTGVIAKPFEPMTLAGLVRREMQSTGFTALRDGFVKRLRADAAILEECRENLKHEASARDALEQIKGFAHALNGAAGIFGYKAVSHAAAALEEATLRPPDRGGSLAEVEQDLDTLLKSIASDLSASRH